MSDMSNDDKFSAVPASKPSIVAPPPAKPVSSAAAEVKPLSRPSSAAPASENVPLYKAPSNNVPSAPISRDKILAAAAAVPRPLVVAAPARANVPSMPSAGIGGKPVAAPLSRPSSVQGSNNMPGQQLNGARAPIVSAPASNVASNGVRRLSSAGSVDAPSSNVANNGVGAKLASAGNVYSSAGINKPGAAPLARVPSSYGVGLGAAAAAAAAVPSKYGFAIGGANARAVPSVAAPPAAAVGGANAYGRYGVGGMRHW